MGSMGTGSSYVSITVQLYKFFLSFIPTAEQALTASYAVFRLRHICEGTAQSLKVAERCAGRLCNM